MTNQQIADSFDLLAKLMDIHGENSFKSKSYASAAFTIEKLTVELSTVDPNSIESIKGIGASSAKKVIEILTTGQLGQLQQLIELTPPGVIQMLSIKGIGPKKINSIWKEMEIESIGELLYACKENRLKLYKGFGEKTQNSVIENIEFFLKSKDSFLLAQVLDIANSIKETLIEVFDAENVALVGEVARQLEIVNSIDFVIQADEQTIGSNLAEWEVCENIISENDKLVIETSYGIKLHIYTAENDFIETVVKHSSSEEFYTALTQIKSANTFKTEEEYFAAKNVGYVPAFARENKNLLHKDFNAAQIIQTKDVKGLIHCHSTWSDGGNTIKEMALAAQQKGLEYMVISDHSKSAFYANGLKEDRIKAQQDEVDELNKKLHPFKIFKSIECDILNDGSLDYSESILSTFDLVIASVHSNLKMSEEKAMARVLGAIENKYTTILGHPTGRLLLSRPGYPLQMETIIDACAKHNVVIELNAHPSRLDIDWRYIQYALDKNVLISIDPDSHSTAGIDDIFYGVLSAQKAAVKPQQNLSSFSLQAFENYLAEMKMKKH
jgi:DNA polymerase (family X)